MDFEVMPEQKAVVEVARRFAERELAPSAAAWDEAEEFPRETFRKMAEIGLTGMSVPEEYGGIGLDRTTIAMVLEELARGCMAMAGCLSVHTLVTRLIWSYGNEEQKHRWVVPLARGEKLGAFALTEPDAGSDAASLQTSATRNGSVYLLNGSKVFVTGGEEAEIYVVLARTDREKGAAGISSFVVEKGTRGFSFGKKERKMGFNAAPTCQLSFADCPVPAENLVGNEGEGFKLAMSSLDGGRVNIGAISIGLARAALEAALSYARERIQFGQPIAAFQAIQFMLADMATEIEAARLLVHRAARLMDRGRAATMMAAMAKRFATDTAMKVTTDAVQIFGGYGYMKDYPVERYMRAAKVGQIVEGTNQIQRLVIARELLKSG